MHSWIKPLVVLAVCATTVTACGKTDEIGDVAPPLPGENGLPALPGDSEKGGKAPIGHIGFQPPIVPITFTINTKGEISVAVSAEIVTPFGKVKVGVNQRLDEDTVTDEEDRELPPPPADEREVIICPAEQTPTRCDRYTIHTGRKLRVAIDGKVVQHIDTRRQVLFTAPGTRIKVTDDGPAPVTGTPGPARVDIEEFKFHATGQDTEVDLERSRSGYRSDLAYNHISGELKAINGARIGRIENYGVRDLWRNLDAQSLPGEKECGETGDWRESFADGDFTDDLTVACVKTAEGDLGYLVLGRLADRRPPAYRVYSHVWVR
ncbi:hypothetical protein ABZ816_28210 [Actinosynnema sp. NPDC047251]|nr:hypothetical protein [Saccharothrix espanaensis]